MGGGAVSYVIHMSENICLWEETHLDPFTPAGTVEQGGLWEIFFFSSFLLADFIWSSWDETQKAGLGLTSAPWPIVARALCAHFCFLFEYLFSLRNKQTRNLAWHLPQY